MKYRKRQKGMMKNWNYHIIRQNARNVYTKTWHCIYGLWYIDYNRELTFIVSNNVSFLRAIALLLSKKFCKKTFFEERICKTKNKVNWGIIYGFTWSFYVLYHFCAVWVLNLTKRLFVNKSIWFLLKNQFDFC